MKTITQSVLLAFSMFSFFSLTSERAFAGEEGAEKAPSDPCAAVRCAAGTQCVSKGSQAQCVPIKETQECKKGEKRVCPPCAPPRPGETSASVAERCRCRCVKVVPNPCATLDCKGGRCELTEVQCIKAPCPKIPRCVASNPCDAVKCTQGMHCELKQVQCIKAPCPPIAQCVPNATPGTRCGTQICKRGTHCEFKQVQCIKAPCPPIGECVPNGSDTPKANATPL